jgi:NAD(P)-dependent dehydrogenase (short-subunit alcohol dehydrogenase family)
MTKVVVIGGTGLIGSKLVATLAEHGHEAIAASRSSGVNTLTGEGLAEVLSGAQVVVDVSDSPSFEDKAVLDFFTTSTGINGTIEIAGPEQFGLDELIRKGLSFRGDPREVVADPEARYFGALLEERTLLPSADVLTLDPGFEDWLTQSAPQK